MCPREKGYPGQVDHHLAALTAGRSWPIGKGPVDVVGGNPGDGADGATSGGEMDEAPGAVTGVLAHPGASQNGPEAWGQVRSTRHFGYGEVVDNNIRPVNVASSLQPRSV